MQEGIKNLKNNAGKENVSVYSHWKGKNSRNKIERKMSRQKRRNYEGDGQKMRNEIG